MVKQPAKVNYFFGRAYGMLWRTIFGSIVKSFYLIKSYGGIFFAAVKLFIKALVRLVVSIFTFDFSEIWDMTKFTLKGLWNATYSLPVFLSVLFFAPMLSISLSGIFLITFLVIMLLIYLAFLSLYGLDLIYRKIRQISNTCSSCQRKIKIPIYFCPNCGAEHTTLIPSKYGILKRTCNCGAKLPTIFLNGREKLDSKCPHCAKEFKEGTDHVDVTIPVVGGPSAGKTCFIHMAIADIEKNSANDHGLHYEYDVTNSADEFAINMNSLNEGVTPAKTNDMRLRFYRFFLQKNKGLKHLISLCDVGGEVYDNSDTLGEQIAFSHTKAFLIVIDPLSVKEYRKELEKKVDNISVYGPSEMEIDDILSMLITTLENMCGIKAKEMLNREVAIVFSKGDLPGLAEKIGASAVSNYMADHPEVSRLDAQNVLCEDFLKEYDEFGFINAVKSKFKTVQFFVTSALGHVEDGSEFDSVNVSEPIYWILDRASKSINLKKLWEKGVDA